METTSKKTPCANSRISGCDGFVTERGTILCKECVQYRDSVNQSRRNNESNNEKYMLKINELSRERDKLSHECKELSREKNEITLERDELVEKVNEYKNELKKIQIHYKDELLNRDKQLIEDNKQLVLKNKLLQLKADENGTEGGYEYEQKLKELSLQNKLLEQKNKEIEYTLEKERDEITTLKRESEEIKNLNIIREQELKELREKIILVTMRNQTLVTKTKVKTSPKKIPTRKGRNGRKGRSPSPTNISGRSPSPPTHLTKKSPSNIPKKGGIPVRKNNPIRKWNTMRI